MPRPGHSARRVLAATFLLVAAMFPESAPAEPLRLGLEAGVTRSAVPGTSTGGMVAVGAGARVTARHEFGLRLALFTVLRAAVRPRADAKPDDGPTVFTGDFVAAWRWTRSPGARASFVAGAEAGPAVDCRTRCDFVAMVGAEAGVAFAGDHLTWTALLRVERGLDLDVGARPSALPTLVFGYAF